MGDAINPDHYKFGSNGAEVIDLTEHLDFLSGNSVKYLCRAGRKASADRLEDARKAQWYVNRLVDKLTRERDASGVKKIATPPVIGVPYTNAVSSGG